MTENAPLGALPSSMSEGYGAAPASTGTTTSQPSTVEIATDQAANVGQGAAEAGQHVASVTKDQALSVVADAEDQIKNLLQQATHQLSEQTSTQHRRAVDGLRSLGQELDSMSQQSGQEGTATDLVRQAAQRTHQMAGWLEAREPGQLVEELRGFARQRPGTFLLAAAGAGLLAGRLTRGAKDASSQSSSGGGGQSSAGDPYASVTGPTSVPSLTPNSMGMGTSGTGVYDPDRPTLVNSDDYLSGGGGL